MLLIVILASSSWGNRAKISTIYLEKKDFFMYPVRYFSRFKSYNSYGRARIRQISVQITVEPTYRVVGVLCDRSNMHLVRTHLIL